MTTAGAPNGFDLPAGAPNGEAGLEGQILTLTLRLVLCLAQGMSWVRVLYVLHFLL